ncbi:uncharacterized protein [Miscanthus floridulus]
MQGYQYHEHMQDPDKNKMMTYSKVEKNAKSTVKIKSVHSGFLPSVARKECAANHGRSRDFCNITLQGCVWGATFCANLSHQRVANAPRAMAGDCNECDIVKGEDQSQSEDNSKCSPQKKATAKGNMMPLSAILFLALILGARHQIIVIMKSKGLDTKRSIILLSSCLCVVKSVYGALKEAKDAGELVMFYLDVTKKGPRDK